MPIETLDIINKRGLHARAAAKFATLANQFKASIQVRVGEGIWADAKSVMSLMLLAASCGSRIEVNIDGEDAEIAMSAIRNLIADRFEEGE
ncbi:HPr family phosphocarrier protein [Cellvibrio fontiphilus]|jgi:phosphotransferase system HPr (HPr) family protein|uniref:HPr family phosphocarrier protein n=1 Tax=Cellvibrio fontiphilus TaxID=1815559 RepID=A0ABV7FJD8_9GAMM|nr:HPr family phosphocarrier protein [Cellvibrio fontiphilus]